MKVNLARFCRIYEDTGSTVNLTEDELAALADGNTTTPAFDVSFGAKFNGICRLPGRVNLDSIKYYCTMPSSDTIKFYGSQSGANAWEALPTTVTSYGVTVSLSGSINKYEYIKINHHTVFVSSDVYELEIYSSDELLSYGELGNFSSYTVDYGTDTLSVLPIFLYNPDSVERQVYSLLDADDPDSLLLGLSESPSGPFYALHEKSYSIPDNFPWSSGSFSNVTETSNKLRLTTGTTGTYYTPVIDISSLDGIRLFWRATLSGTNEIDTTSKDSLPTVYLRRSNIAPTNPWVSGQLSTDALWSVASGTLSFVPYANNTIMSKPYAQYAQFKVEFSSPSSGQSPELLEIGFEEAASVLCPTNSGTNVYVKTLDNGYVPNQSTGLITWHFSY